MQQQEQQLFLELVKVFSLTSPFLLWAVLAPAKAPESDIYRATGVPLPAGTKIKDERKSLGFLQTKINTIKVQMLLRGKIKAHGTNVASAKSRR